MALWRSIAERAVRAVMVPMIQDQFNALLAEARYWKPTGYNTEMEDRHLYYRGDMDDDLRQRLSDLFPLTYEEMDRFSVGLVRKVVNRLAAVYHSPASRVLARDGEPLPPDDAQVVLWDNIQAAAGYHRYWKKQDRYTRLFRTQYGRATWDGMLKRVVWRAFPPYCVERVPDPDWPEDINRDRAVFLRLNSYVLTDTGTGLELDDDLRVRGGQQRGNEAQNSRWEVWYRTGEDRDGYGIWRWGLYDGAGKPLEMPTGNPEGTNPYRDEAGHEVLPITVLYDEDPDGEAFLDAGHDLLVVARALNVQVTDLIHMIRHQAHGERWVKSQNPKAKFVAGASKIHLLGPDDEMGALSLNPLITDSVNAIQQLIYWFAIMNNMSPNQFRVDRQALTGVALKVENLDLMEDRSDHIEVYREPENEHFRKMRAVWNYHAPEQLAWDLDMNWHPGTVSTPVDDEAIQRRYLVDIREGTASVVDYVMERDGVDRETAAKTLDRVHEEQELHGKRREQYRQQAQGDVEQDQSGGSNAAPADDSSDELHMRGIKGNADQWQRIDMMAQAAGKSRSQYMMSALLED